MTHELRSVCSVCLNDIPATVVVRDGTVWLEKECPAHGREVVLESSSERFYYRADTLIPESARLGQALADPLGPTCVALFEITDVCNLECPLCFAGSGPGGGYFMPLAEFERRLAGVISERGKIDIAMVSGGEPTVHPQFGEILRVLTQSPDVGRVLVNTNGLLLAKESAARNAVLGSLEKLELYLQFDSVRPETAEVLRGKGTLVQEKAKALLFAEQHGVPTTLAAAVKQGTEVEEVAELLSAAFASPVVRGITLQPVFASGRHKIPYDPSNRLTTPDVVDLVVKASGGAFSIDAFTNLPCSHPNCAVVAYFYRALGKIWPLVQDVVPLPSLKKRINFNLDDLKQCGCETTELGKYVRSAELSADNSFRIVVKPFMDRFTLNRDRTAQCCTHVIGPEGRRMSFCEYNVFRDQLGWNTP